MRCSDVRTVGCCVSRVALGVRDERSLLGASCGGRRLGRALALALALSMSMAMAVAMAVSIGRELVVGVGFAVGVDLRLAM